MKHKPLSTGNKDVATALELLTGTLTEEKTRIFAIGSQTMIHEDTRASQAVLDFAKKLGGFIGKVEKLQASWAKLQAIRDRATPQVQEVVGDKLFGQRTRKATTGFKQPGKHLSSKTNFSVRFPDGTVMMNKKASVTFAQVIEKLGPAAVAKIGLICCGEPLVSRSKSAKYPTDCAPLSGGYFVLTHTSTDVKIIFIKKMAIACHVLLSVTKLESRKADCESKLA